MMPPLGVLVGTFESLEREMIDAMLARTPRQTKLQPDRYNR